MFPDMLKASLYKAVTLLPQVKTTQHFHMTGTPVSNRGVHDAGTA